LTLSSKEMMGILGEVLSINQVSGTKSLTLHINILMKKKFSCILLSHFTSDAE